MADIGIDRWRNERSQDAERIPVLRPQLPATEHLLPYLRRIDASRIYTNWGPLVREFESRLAATWNLAPECVVSASSGTAALVGAILAVAGRATRERPLAVVPSFTFVATASAVQQCGFQPYFADVDAGSWMLDPLRLLQALPAGQVGLLIVTAPFGRPVPQAPWRRFQASTGIPVVIDGAASLEGLSRAPREHIGEIPVSLSFHATKSFAVGEGGCVAVTDVHLGERVTQALNFGFRGARESEIANINGKLSEYHAAVGLAELDGWPDKLARLTRVVEGYRQAFAQRVCAGHPVALPDISTSYFLWSCRNSSESTRIHASLRRSEIGFRLWYGHGLHRQPAFATSLHESLDVTDNIAPTLVGLPMAPDLSPESMAAVAEAIERAV